MNALIIYDSPGGNTRKIANSILRACKDRGIDTTILEVDPGLECDFFAYDLIFAGSGVIDWLPTNRFMDFIRKQMKALNAKGLIKPSAPILPGKFGVCFSTFAGPHNGTGEARPMTAWLKSFMEHLGYIVLDRWHIPGSFKNNETLNTKGRLGNITTRPNNHDTDCIYNQTLGIINALENFINPEKPKC